MESKRIASEIDYDIERGVYDDYEKLKGKLMFIRDKLVIAAYSKNVKLTDGEMIALKENDYV